MATINLRPWRAERRERLKREFINITGVFAIAGVLVWFGWSTVVNGLIKNQNERNKMLDSEIKSLDLKVQEINELKDKKADLVERMKAIQSLQGTRPVIVHLFDELAKTMPEGVFYKKIERKGSKIFVEGTAESNQRVSTLMRNLDESEWLDNPNLTKVVANKSVGEQGNDFVLTFDISTPGFENLEEAKEEPVDPKAAKGKKPAAAASKTGAAKAPAKPATPSKGK